MIVSIIYLTQLVVVFLNNLIKMSRLRRCYVTFLPRDERLMCLEVNRHELHVDSTLDRYQSYGSLWTYKVEF